MIEIIVAVSVLTILFLAIAKYFSVAAKQESQALLESKAGYLLEEGMEAVQFLRNESFRGNLASLATSTPYFLIFDGTDWTATTTPVVIDGKLSRTFELEDVYRDANGNIASSGALDPGAKKVTVSVAWKNSSGQSTSTRSLQAYVMDLYND